MILYITDNTGYYVLMAETTEGPRGLVCRGRRDHMRWPLHTLVTFMSQRGFRPFEWRAHKLVRIYWDVPREYDTYVVHITVS